MAAYEKCLTLAAKAERKPLYAFAHHGHVVVDDIFVLKQHEDALNKGWVC